MIDLKEIEASGEVISGIREFLLYFPEYEEKLTDFENIELYTAVMCYLDDGSKIRFDRFSKQTTFYDKDYNDYKRSKEQINFDLARNIKKIMQLRGFTQEDLANQVGLSQATFSNYLSLKHGSIPAWLLIKLSDILNYDLKELQRG